MEVILLERVENLGFMGDVVKVRDGYARNYLLPQKKALRKSKANLEYFESQKVELEALNLKRKEEAEAAGEKIDGMSLILVRQASEGGQLYGSVTARDIGEALKDEGVTISRGQVLLKQPIKALGQYEIRIGLHPEVAVLITATVARTQEEAEAQISGVPTAQQLAEMEAEAAEAAAAEEAAANDPDYEDDEPVAEAAEETTEA
ncbi:MAG: 50S ribosomal protein L9 [Rhodospirillaceae bacterium]